MGYQCCSGPNVARRYINNAERVAWLKEYAEALSAELTGVQERLKELEVDA